MIVGLFLRNYKSFKNQHYIPISLENNSCYFIGENGVGKSSILSALDTLLNNSDISKLDVNNELKSSGYDSREPFIVPVFLIEKEKTKKHPSMIKLLEVISSITWQVEFEDFNSLQRPLAEKFTNHRNILSKKYSENTHYLIPIGFSKNKPTEMPVPTMSIFDSIVDYDEELNELTQYTTSSRQKRYSFTDTLARVLLYVREIYDFIYLPAEITVSSYSKIEGALSQSLLGDNIQSIISKIIKKKDIDDINLHLNNYLDKIAKLLNNNYDFKKPSQRQTLFSQKHMIIKIIETFFNDRILHRKKDGKDTPINNLSSGEKRHALLDLATAFLRSNPKRSYNYTIFAIDEPELSLHATACFKQFEKIKQISELGIQTLVTTHWYGFLPAVGRGTAVYISPNQELIKALNLDNYKDEISNLVKESNGSYLDILEVKSNHDLVQSIIASISSKNSYNWILCEGKTDKKYIETHLEFESIENIIVLPVGGSVTLKEIYTYLCLALKDRRKNITGKVFCLLDTDAKYEKFISPYTAPNILIKRLMFNSDKNEISLLNTTDSQFSPPTEIEDALDSIFYYEALLSLYLDDGDKRFKFIETIEQLDSDVSAGSLDLTLKQQNFIKNYFDEPGKKEYFCNKYCSTIILSDEIRTPKWLTEIIDLLIPNRDDLL